MDNHDMKSNKIIYNKTSFRGLSIQLILLTAILSLAQAEGIRSYHEKAGPKKHPLGTIHMQLDFRGPQIKGVCFHKNELSDIKLQGQFTDEKKKRFVLQGKNKQGKLVSTFRLRFVSTDPDPSGPWSPGSKLGRELIMGNWIPQKDGHHEPNPIRLESSGIAAGIHTLDDFYFGSNDDLIHRNAFTFWNGVLKQNKTAVASVIEYPISVTINKAIVQIEDKKSFTKLYHLIFTPKYRRRIIEAVPRYMFSRDSHGVMLGHGEVWFDFEGKVVALNRIER